MARIEQVFLFVTAGFLLAAGASAYTSQDLLAAMFFIMANQWAAMFGVARLVGSIGDKIDDRHVNRR